MSHWLVQAFASYGFAVIVIAIYLEGCGVPLPGETVLLAGGFFARQGSLPLLGVLVAAFLAAVAGDNSGYWIGRRGGRALVERHGRWVGLTAQRLEAIAGFYDRHGAKTILIARFLSGVRAFAPLFAGISRIPWRRYAAVDAVACLLWSTAVGLVGYAFGESWQHIEHWIGRAGLSLLVLAAGLLMLRAAERHRDRVQLWVRESLGRLGPRPRHSAGPGQRQRRRHRPRSPGRHVGHPGGADRTARAASSWGQHGRGRPVWRWRPGRRRHPARLELKRGG